MPHIGCSSSRHGFTIRQHVAANNLLLNILFKAAQGMDAARSITFHHGDCVGGDAALHDSAAHLGFKVVIHPPEKDALRAFKSCDDVVILPPKHYLIRNRDIVDACSYMLICPNTPDYALRSGAWYTCKYALKMGRKVVLVTPDGNVGHVRAIERSKVVFY